MCWGEVNPGMALFCGFLSLVLRKGWAVDGQKEGKGFSNPGNSYAQGLRWSRVQTEAGQQIDLQWIYDGVTML